MTEALTIDNLPIETSVQWAESQEYLERKYIDDTKYIRYQTDISVVEPKYEHLTLLFEQNKKAPTWASFPPPPSFSMQSTRLFYQDLIPDLDPLSLIERCQETIENGATALSSTLLDSSHRLLGCLETLETLNKLLWEIRSKILQYRKG
jgi:hypothetical protein